MMENNIENIDEIIRDSMIESRENNYPIHLTEKVLKSIYAYKLWQSILFDFGIKAGSIFLSLIVFVLIILGFESANPSGWLTFLISNSSLIVASLFLIFVIFFINEVTEKYLVVKR